MSKYIIIVVVSIIVGAGISYYFAPEKEKIVEKIVYKDKIINAVQVKTITKDGEVKIITKTNTVEVEKIKEIEKISNVKTRSLYILPAINLNGDKYIGLAYSNKLIFSFDYFIGVSYYLNYNYITHSMLQVGLKYNF